MADEHPGPSEPTHPATGGPAGLRPLAGEAYRAAYDELLAQAIATMTAAARLHWLPASVGAAGAGPEDAAGGAAGQGEGQTVDWAEFVTLVLAGAAANLGGIEEALAGRPGSWEAAGVRELLASTVGPNEADLWRHRTEPLEVTIDVEAILSEVAPELSLAYDDAARELTRRWEAADAANPIEVSDYAWVYERSIVSGWVPLDPAAPAFSTEAWLRELRLAGAEPEFIAAAQAQLVDPASLMVHVQVAKSDQARVELERLYAERELALAPFELDDQLEAQRLAEVEAYGRALAARVEAGLEAELPVAVPVTVRLNLAGSPAGRYDPGVGGAMGRIVEDAVSTTLTPAELPGTPLTRLEAAIAAEQDAGL